MICVVLTTAFRVQVGTSVLTDPAHRTAQYAAAIARWRDLRAAEISLHVMDCSGVPIDEVRTSLGQLAKGLAITSYSPSLDVISRGKGAIEASAMDDLMCSGAVPDNTTVFKATGRLTIANATRLLRPVSVETVVARRRADYSWVDTRFIGFRPHTWRSTFSGMAKEVDDARGVYVEHIAGYRLLRGISTHEVQWRPFEERPRFAGSSGTTGERYRPMPTAVMGTVMRPLEAALRVAAGRKYL